MLKALILSAALTNFYDVKITRFTDGDTVAVDLGEDYPDVFRFIGVRLSGIDTPEMSSKKKCERKDAAASAKRLTELVGANPVDLIDCQGDKFWRLRCDLIAGDTDVSAVLLSEGLAVVYHGEKKPKYTCSR